MSLFVCKFGGSSVSDAEMFLRVREILRACPDRRYIVLSAPGKRTPSDEKITDLLYRVHESGGTGDQYIFARIFQRYATIRDRLAPDFDLEAEFSRLRRGVHSADFTVSRGEYLCAKLFSAFSGLPFVDAAELFFFGADGKIDLHKTRRRSREKLKDLSCAVIPGFYGTAPDCGIRTFTRGGSDVSGALLAAALDADCYENWTDVDGLYSADPNIVPGALRHTRVSLQQMERIARAGAQLLHPDALSPLRGTGIETMLKNTHAPECPGTRISENFHETLPCVTGMRGMYLDDGMHIGSLPAANARRVAVVSAFGLSDAALPAIKTELQPIHIIHMQDHKQIIIEEEKYADSVRKIHSILIRGNTI